MGNTCSQWNHEGIKIVTKCNMRRRCDICEYKRQSDKRYVQSNIINRILSGDTTMDPNDDIDLLIYDGIKYCDNLGRVFVELLHRSDINLSDYMTDIINVIEPNIDEYTKEVLYPRLIPNDRYK